MMDKDPVLKEAVEFEIKNLTSKDTVHLLDDSKLNMIALNFPNQNENRSLIESTLTQTVEDRVKFYLEKCNLPRVIK